LIYVKKNNNWREFMLDAQQKITFLNQSVLFQGIHPALLQRVADIALTRSFARGSSIFFEGDAANGFYLLVQGQVKVFKMSLEGKEQILHIFGPGQPFGEVPVFHGEPFPAHAVSLIASTTLFFPRQEFIALLKAAPDLALSMLAVLSRRLRQFASQVESLSLKEVPERLAQHLLYLAEKQGRSDAVLLDIPKGQLASLLGTSPETLSRIFAQMSNQGLIRVEGKTIWLLRPQELLRSSLSRQIFS
jgi:CRP/FNR family transcriptional regulator, dissimilatory nitrate respiration regulator